MKKLQLLTKRMLMVLGLSFAGTVLFGQGAYVQVQTGYGLKMGAMNGNSSGVASTTYFSSERTTYSYGAGLTFGGVLGYMLNKNMGVELGVSYLLGATTSTEYFTSFANNDVLSKWDNKGRMWRFAPTFVLSPDYNIINPYVKMGLLFGVGSFERKLLQNYSSNNTNSVFESTQKYSGGMAIGHTSALGATLKINQKAGIFMELNMVNLTYSPTKREYIMATQNGKNTLPDYILRDKETRYVNELNTSNANTSENEPDVQIKTAYPFSSIGINVGFHYAF